MAALPVLLVVLTVASANWTVDVRRHAAAGSGSSPGLQIAEGSRRALTGLPRQAVAARHVELPASGLQPAQVSPPISRASPLDVSPSRAVSDLPAEVVPAVEPVPGMIVTERPGAPWLGLPMAETAVIAVPRVDDVPALPALSVPGKALSPVPDQSVGVIAAARHDPQTIARVTERGTLPERVMPGPVLSALSPSDTERSHSEFPGQCVAPPPKSRPRLDGREIAAQGPDAFGLALAQAARDQLDEFVIYNDRYRRIAYPMGDVHPMYGVCTDVVVRAYRVLGIDLQELVQKTRSGSGDPNIDHRRVDTLRRFFTRFGESLPISSFAEDYRPGDIVTYYRPQNSRSRTHIAVVSDFTTPSGRPLIIHNRGWGPQQEDGLFVDQITGHFRFQGLRTAPVVARSQQSKPAAASKMLRGSPGSDVLEAGMPVPKAPR